MKENNSTTQKRGASSKDGGYARHPDKKANRRASWSPREDQEIIRIDKPEVQIRPHSEEDIEVIDVDELEQKLEEEIFQEREPSRGRKSEHRKSTSGPRNAPVVLPLVKLDRFRWNDVFLKEGKTVELTDGSFLKIKVVIQNLQTDEITLRGWKLQRARELGGILPLKLNEVTFVFEVDLNDQRHYLEQSIVEVTLKDLGRLRKLICTNRPFPKNECRFDNIPADTPKQREYIEKHEVLTARWKWTTKFHGSRERLENENKPNNYHSRQLESLNEEECTSGHAIPASLLRLFWRGETILGGSGTIKRYEGKPERHPSGVTMTKGRPTEIHLIEGEDENQAESNKGNDPNYRRRVKSDPKQEQVYTYGDTCEYSTPPRECLANRR
jgi:DNA (cytosine-5)-methyltransferase 1